MTADGGTFTLTFGGQTTAAIDHNATHQSVQAKLEALSTILAGNVSVSGNGPYTVEFIGALAEANQDEMTADDTSLTGEGKGVAIATVQAGGIGAAPSAGNTTQTDRQRGPQ